MPDAPTTAVPAPDETLVEQARRGDRAALEELFHRHRGVAYRVAYRLLGHEHDALDAAQEGLIKAFAHLRDFDGRSRFQTWLLRIVSNAARDVGRKRRRHQSLRSGTEDHSGTEPIANDDPAQGLNRHDLRRTIEAALDRLSPKLRLTFVLFAEGGLSYEEVAAAQGIAVGTVMSRIHYARRKL